MCWIGRYVANYCTLCLEEKAKFVLIVGAGVGIGSVFAALIQGTARNPSLRGWSSFQRTCSEADDDALYSPTVSICYSWVRFCGGSGSLQSDGRLYSPLWLLDSGVGG